MSEYINSDGVIYCDVCYQRHNDNHSGLIMSVDKRGNVNAVCIDCKDKPRVPTLIDILYGNNQAKEVTK